jgi:putative sterol carrier protein
MPIFPSEEWLDAWVARANESEEFVASGAGWDGSVGAVIEADGPGVVPETLYVRLDGFHGRWLGQAMGTDAALVDGTLFVLRAPYAQWKRVIRQELHPIKGLLTGRIRITGHLPEILKWTKSIMILAELAAGVDTEFGDEGARGSASQGPSGGV